MTFFETVRNADRSHWKDAGIWLLFNLVGALAPVWLGFIPLKVFSHDPTLDTFSQHGEFALYSAAMFAPALYIILRDLAVPGFAGRQILGLVAFVGMLLATAFYAPVATAVLVPIASLKIDQEFVTSGTLLLFLGSVVFAFFITVLDNARLTPDPRRLEAEQQTELGKQFDKLGGAQ